MLLLASKSAKDDYCAGRVSLECSQSRPCTAHPTSPTAKRRPATNSAPPSSEKPAPRRGSRAQADRALGRRALPPGQDRPGGRDGPEHQADAAAGLQPRSDAPRGPLALAAGGRHVSPLPCQRGGSDPAGGGLRGAPEPRALHHRRPPLGQRPPRPRRGETALLKVDVV